MYVYRVENADGCGPYNTGSHYMATMQICDTPEFSEWASQHYRCPCPDADIGAKWKALLNAPWEEPHPSYLTNFDILEYRFGFRTLQELWNWFGDCLHVLYDPPKLNVTREPKGFAVAIYEVSPKYVLHGMKQVAYIGKQATLIGVIPEYRFVKEFVNPQPVRQPA